MRYLAILFMLSISTLCNAQQASTDVRIGEAVGSPKPTKDAVYTSVEKFGGLKGDITDWNKYVEANVKYPEKAKTDGLKGKVFINFVIEPDGTTSNIKVLRHLREDCDNEAIRLVKESKWNPSFIQNTAVRTGYTVAVTF